MGSCPAGETPKGLSPLRGSLLEGTRALAKKRGLKGGVSESGAPFSSIHEGVGFSLFSKLRLMVAPTRSRHLAKCPNSSGPRKWLWNPSGFPPNTRHFAGRTWAWRSGDFFCGATGGVDSEPIGRIFAKVQTWLRFSFGFLL